MVCRTNLEKYLPKPILAKSHPSFSKLFLLFISSNIVSNLFDNINDLLPSNIYDLIIINKVKFFIETRYQQKYVIEGEG